MKTILWNDNATGRALMLANMGIATKTISESTGLSISQIRYRMKKAGIKLSDYRYGRSQLSRWLAHCAVNAARSRLNRMKAHEVAANTLTNYRPIIDKWRADKKAFDTL